MKTRSRTKQVRHPDEQRLSTREQDDAADLNVFAPSIQAAHLHDSRLNQHQRQQTALQISHTNGNRYLRRVLAEKHPAASAPAVSPMVREAASTAQPARAIQRGILGDIGSAIGNFFSSVWDAIVKFFQPKYINKVRSVAILDKAYGKYAKITEGKVEVLSQAEFQAAYDKVYGETEYSWDKYVVPKFGNLEGFAHEGVNYINEDKMSVDTTPHEMLHSNTAPAFTTLASGNINEGATEYLTIKAVSAEGFTPTHSYPNQEAVIRDLVAVVGEETLLNAYFKGEADALKTAMETNCKGTWAEFKAAMDAEDWVKAKALVVKK